MYVRSNYRIIDDTLARSRQNSFIEIVSLKIYGCEEHKVTLLTYYQYTDAKHIKPIIAIALLKMYGYEKHKTQV